MMGSWSWGVCLMTLNVAYIVVVSMLQSEQITASGEE
jgi:hypothetical protein